jgi:cell wall-associated NlpC family hydrolase
VTVHSRAYIIGALHQPRRACLIGVIATLLLVAGCAGAPSRHPRDREPVPVPAPTEPGTASTDEIRRSIAELALSMVGVPYRYGGADPDTGFDCSGLVYYTYTSVGRSVPRTSEAQFRAAQKISLDEAAAGDLLFFEEDVKLSHVGIYLGDRRFVHAPSTGATVSVASVDAPWYRRRLVAVGRLIP